MDFVAGDEVAESDALYDINFGRLSRCGLVMQRWVSRKEFLPYLSAVSEDPSIEIFAHSAAAWAAYSPAKGTPPRRRKRMSQ